MLVIWLKKRDLNAKITEVEDKIVSISGLATNSALTAVEKKISDIKNLPSKTELTTLENKIPNVSNLVPKITKIKSDYVTTTALDARHKDLVQKNIF